MQLTALLGLICGLNGCTSPIGATATVACPDNYFACPASLNGNCCASGLGCGLNSCYTLSPATTTLTYTTTEDGSVLTIKTTSITTATPTDLATATGDGAIAKYYPSTVAKTKATESAGAASGGSAGGLSKGAIGGIVAAAVIILIAVLAAAFFILKRLKHTEQVVQTHRETTSGTRTRQTTEKNKSEVQVRVVPTPSEVDAFDYDPLMMNSSVASPLRPGQRPAAPRSRHVRGGSETGSQPSLWSGQSATRWPTPSVNSEPDDRSGPTTYFELPPRAHHTNDAARPTVRQSVNSNDSSAYTYHDYAAHRHGRQTSNASELSGDENGVLMPKAVELEARGAFTPELPGSDTEGESNSGGRRRSAPKRKGTAASINDIVSPMSVRPGATQPGRPRRRGDSQIVSPMDGQTVVAGGAASLLGSIDESVSVRASHSLHGHYGPDPGEREADARNSRSTVPGFVPLERPSQDGSERR